LTHSFVIPEGCLDKDAEEADFMFSLTKAASRVRASITRLGSIVTIESPDIEERSFAKMPGRVTDPVTALSMMLPDGSRRQSVITWNEQTGEIRVYPDVAASERLGFDGSQCLSFNPIDTRNADWYTKETSLGHVTHANPSAGCSVSTFRPLNTEEISRLKHLRAELKKAKGSKYEELARQARARAGIGH
jgi:hypothetical protein